MNPGDEAFVSEGVAVATSTSSVRAAVNPRGGFDVVLCFVLLLREAMVASSHQRSPDDIPLSQQHDYAPDDLSAPWYSYHGEGYWHCRLCRAWVTKDHVNKSQHQNAVVSAFQRTWYPIPAGYAALPTPYAVRTGGKDGKDNGKGIQPPDIQPPLPPVPPPPVAPVSSAATSATSASSPTCRICLQAPGEDRVKDLEARLTVLEDQVKDLEARLKNAGSLPSDSAGSAVSLPSDWTDGEN